MSDYRDIIKNAGIQGITLDGCGSDERAKTWGLYSDLCGMSVEDALAAQTNSYKDDSSSSKKTTYSISGVTYDDKVSATTTSIPIKWNGITTTTQDGVSTSAQTATDVVTNVTIPVNLSNEEKTISGTTNAISGGINYGKITYQVTQDKYYDKVEYSATNVKTPTSVKASDTSAVITWDAVETKTLSGETVSTITTSTGNKTVVTFDANESDTDNVVKGTADLVLNNIKYGTVEYEISQSKMYDSVTYEATEISYPESIEYNQTSFDIKYKLVSLYKNGTDTVKTVTSDSFTTITVSGITENDTNKVVTLSDNVSDDKITISYNVKQNSAYDEINYSYKEKSIPNLVAYNATSFDITWVGTKEYVKHHDSEKDTIFKTETTDVQTLTINNIATNNSGNIIYLTGENITLKVDDDVYTTEYSYSVPQDSLYNEDETEIIKNITSKDYPTNIDASATTIDVKYVVTTTTKYKKNGVVIDDLTTTSNETVTENVTIADKGNETNEDVSITKTIKTEYGDIEITVVQKKQYEAFTYKAINVSYDTLIPASATTFDIQYGIEKVYTLDGETVKTEEVSSGNITTVRDIPENTSNEVISIPDSSVNVIYSGETINIPYTNVKHDSLYDATNEEKSVVDYTKEKLIAYNETDAVIEFTGSTKTVYTKDGEKVKEDSAVTTTDSVTIENVFDSANTTNVVNTKTIENVNTDYGTLTNITVKQDSLYDTIKYSVINNDAPKTVDASGATITINYTGQKDYMKGTSTTPVSSVTETGSVTVVVDANNSEDGSSRTVSGSVVDGNYTIEYSMTQESTNKPKTLDPTYYSYAYAKDYVTPTDISGWDKAEITALNTDTDITYNLSQQTEVDIDIDEYEHMDDYIVTTMIAIPSSTNYTLLDGLSNPVNLSLLNTITYNDVEYKIYKLDDFSSTTVYDDNYTFNFTIKYTE